MKEGLLVIGLLGWWGTLLAAPPKAAPPEADSPKARAAAAPEAAPPKARAAAAPEAALSKAREAAPPKAAPPKAALPKAREADPPKARAAAAPEAAPPKAAPPKAREAAAPGDPPAPGAPSAGAFPRFGLRGRRRPLRVASYTITARLDAKAHTVAGRLSLDWVNPSDRPAAELPFHLYLNAFRNRSTIFMREAWMDGGRLPKVTGGWGGITVSRVRVDGQPAQVSLPGDATVMRVRPVHAVGGGARVRVTLRFRARLPKVRARTGYAGDFHLVAQWFPKIGVRLASGEWRCPPFHLLSEFFADFGRYDVTLEVPAGYGLAATGRRVSRTRVAGGAVRARYVADPVHDFAWMAAPHVSRRSRRLGEVTLTVAHTGVDSAAVDRHLAVMAEALRRLQAWYGPYPYPTLTAILVPDDAEAAGGMEYPTFFTSSAKHPPGLERFNALGTTVHELVHQYFYGLLASNEHEEPWLDEGFTTFVTGQVLDDLYGADRSILALGPLRLGYFPFTRFWVHRMLALDPSRRAAPSFATAGSYFASVYGRTALVLKTLEAQIGRSAMRGLLRDYVARFRFRHPTGEGFLAVMDRHVPDPLLRRFVRDALSKPARLAYRVARVRAVKVPAWAGRLDTEGDRNAKAAYEARRKRAAYRNRVLVARTGALRIPITVALRFEDGTERRVRWDGQARYHWIELGGRQPVISAVVDPDRTLALEDTLLDNGLSRRADLRPARRIAGRLLVALQGVLGTVGF